MARVTDAENVTSLVELLDELIDVPEPVPVSMVPATVGWAVAGTVLLVGLGYLLVRRWRRYLADAYRRAALRELDRAADDPARVAEILRRTALSAYARREVAGLAGTAWIGFLEARCPGCRFESLGQMLIDAPYRPFPSTPELTSLARRWIRGHQVP